MVLGQQYAVMVGIIKMLEWPVGNLDIHSTVCVCTQDKYLFYVFSIYLGALASNDYFTHSYLFSRSSNFMCEGSETYLSQCTMNQFQEDQSVCTSKAGVICQGLLMMKSCQRNCK